MTSTCGGKKEQEGFCPEIWDQLLCWPSTPAGTIANQPCPKLPLFNYSTYAFRECWSNGSWFVHPIYNRPWTNYSLCLPKDEYQFRSHINQLYVIGYSISLVALLLSLFIFIKFRTLRCTRIKVHIQLFLSYALANIMWIVYYHQVIDNISVYIENSIWCQILHVLLKYLTLANYMWMFCEAVNLHITLVIVFISDNGILIWFYLVGWGLPVLFVTGYSCYRIFLEKDTHLCWLTESYSANWILTIPLCISLILSLGFFAKVLRTIITVSSHQVENQQPKSAKRIAKAALILIPLFGLQHLLLAFRPNDLSFEHLFEYLSVAIVSSQGLCVSVLFCFANEEVHHAVRTYFQRDFLNNTRWSHVQYTGTTDSGPVYMVNGANQVIPMLPLKRKSTEPVSL